MKHTKVLGLLGKRGSGKDTAAQVLVEGGWRSIAFADALYAEVAKAFGVTVEFLRNRATKELPLPELALKNTECSSFVEVVLDEEHEPNVSDETLLNQPRSPREIVQYWGTNYRRQLFGSNYWIQLVRNAIDADPDSSWVVTDVRYPNEAALVMSYQGTLARIVSSGAPALHGDAATLEKTEQHDSEQQMNEYPVQKVFLNDFSPAGLARTRYAVALEYLADSPLVKKLADVYELTKNLQEVYETNCAQEESASTIATASNSTKESAVVSPG